MLDPSSLINFFQFVSKKIDLGQKLPLRGQISPTKFIILWQNFYVYAPKSIKTHCFFTHDTHRKILILLQRKKFCPKTTLKTPITGLFWSHWSHIAPPGNHWSLLQYTGIAWQLMVTNSAHWSHLAPHGAKFKVFSCYAWRLQPPLEPLCGSG